MVILKRLPLLRRWPFTSVNVGLVMLHILAYPFYRGYESGVGAALFVLDFTVGVLFWLSSEALFFFNHGRARPGHYVYVVLVGLSLSVGLDLIVRKLLNRRMSSSALKS